MEFARVSQSDVDRTAGEGGGLVVRSRPVKAEEPISIPEGFRLRETPAGYVLERTETGDRLH